MSVSVSVSKKGKSREISEPEGAPSSGSSSESDSDVSSNDSEDSESESEEEITEEYMNSLLEKAKQAARARKAVSSTLEEQQVIQLGEEGESAPLPQLEPGSLPPSYIVQDESNPAGPSRLRDLDSEQLQKTTVGTPAPPPDPKATKKPSKTERKKLKNKTTGPGWFDLPAPAEADLPRLSREVEALRLRNQLDPKRFYKKEEGEGKGIKGLPKHFAIGTILPTDTPFGRASADNLSRTHRKRTLVDELVDDAEAKSYAKKKFKELQTVRGARGRGTLAQRQALRRPKW